MSLPIFAAIRANSDRWPVLSALLLSSGLLASLEALARSEADSTHARNSLVRSLRVLDMLLAAGESIQGLLGSVKRTRPVGERGDCLGRVQERAAKGGICSAAGVVGEVVVAL